MIIDSRNFALNKQYKFHEDVDFSSHIFDKNFHIKEITKCSVNINATQFEECLHLSVLVNAEIVARCAYTNDDVPYSVRAKEDMTFSHDEENDGHYFEKDEVFDFDPYLLALISNEVPLNLVKQGAKKPEGGNGFRVLTEDELLKEREKNIDPRWSALDKVLIDDDENN